MGTHVKSKPSDAVTSIERHSIGGAYVSITPHFIDLIGRNLDGKVVEVHFTPYQGVKFTTGDCFRVPSPEWAIYSNWIFEVRDSAWLRELKSQLKNCDATADFMDKSKHFIVATNDVVIEIIAHGWTIKKVRNRK